MVATACRGDGRPRRRPRAPAGSAAAHSGRGRSCPEADRLVALVAEGLRLRLTAAAEDDRAVLRVGRRVNLVALSINEAHVAGDLVRPVRANLDLDRH